MNSNIVILLVILSLIGIVNSYNIKITNNKKINPINLLTNQLIKYKQAINLKSFQLLDLPNNHEITSTNTNTNKKTLDLLAVASYISATSIQWSLIIGFLHLIQFVVLPNISIYIPVNYQSKVKSVFVFILFAFLSLRSRVFSPLDNKRPNASKEDPIFKNRLRPNWQPPPLAFPIIWSTISLLRSISSTLIFTSVNSVLNPAIYSFILHLCIGDTWNTINNVENRLGTASLGALFVWISVVNAVKQYYTTNQLAGYILFPSAIWLTIANVLVYSIWRLNYERFNKPSLYPSKEEGPLSSWRLPFTKFNS